MKKLLSILAFAIIIFLFSINQLKAQAITIGDSLTGWDYSWVAGLNGSQAYYSNWAKGGVNSISVNGHSAITGKYREGRFSYGVLLLTRYGKTKIGDEGIRKTDDLLLLKNIFLYDLSDKDSKFSFFGEVNFRTQFDRGFEYNAGPNGEDILISRFMAPAYFAQSAGLAYVPNEIYSFQAGLGLKQRIVTDDDLETLYGLDEGSTIRNAAGITLGANFKHPIVKNFILSSSLETFTNINTPISSTDIYFSNTLIGKINSFMNVSLRFDMVYNDDFSEEVQILQTLSLGVTFVII